MSSFHYKSPNGTHRPRPSPPAIGDDDLKLEDGAPDVNMADARPTYKSWKKKYRKMRIKFDQLQAQNEELYQLEQKALRKTKQLAIYNEYACLCLCLCLGSKAPFQDL